MTDEPKDNSPGDTPWSEDVEPRRWVDEAPTEGLSDFVHGLVDSLPSEAAVARLAARVAENTPPPAGPSGGLSALKAAAVLMLVVGGGAGAWMMADSPPDASAVEGAPRPVTEREAESLPEIVEAPPRLAPETEDSALEESPSEHPHVASMDTVEATTVAVEVRPSQASARAAQPVGLDEITLLQEARMALRSAPQRALTLARTHRRHFPEGDFVEEREVIAIDALHALGRTRAAQRRAARFLARWPQSAHRSHLTGR